jgi:hypothetical protein
MLVSAHLLMHGLPLYPSNWPSTSTRHAPYIHKHQQPSINIDAAACPPVDVWVALVTHQAVLLAVVEPVPRAPRANESLQAVGLHPDQLVNALVAPLGQQLAAQLQRTAWRAGR